MIELVPLDYEKIAVYQELFEPELWPALQVARWEDEQTYLTQCLDRQKRGIPTFFYLIYAVAEQSYVGAIQIRLPEENPGQLYCWIQKKYRGKGYIQAAIRTAAHFYFDQTGLLEFTARVYCDNLASYKALQKAGFKSIGVGKGPYGNQWILLFHKDNL
jgi:RimJ/RimL family protein N-acetyltransferase